MKTIQFSRKHESDKMKNLRKLSNTHQDYHFMLINPDKSTSTVITNDLLAEANHLLNNLKELTFLVKLSILSDSIKGISYESQWLKYLKRILKKMQSKKN